MLWTSYQSIFTVEKDDYVPQMPAPENIYHTIDLFNVNARFIGNIPKPDCYPVLGVSQDPDFTIRGTIEMIRPNISSNPSPMEVCMGMRQILELWLHQLIPYMDTSWGEEAGCYMRLEERKRRMTVQYNPVIIMYVYTYPFLCLYCTTYPKNKAVDILIPFSQVTGARSRHTSHSYVRLYITIPVFILHHLS